MRFAYDAIDQLKLVSQVAAIPCTFYVDRQNSLFNLAVNVETDERYRCSKVEYGFKYACG